jgi:hypothetical protein
MKTWQVLISDGAKEHKVTIRAESEAEAIDRAVAKYDPLKLAMSYRIEGASFLNTYIPLPR